MKPILNIFGYMAIYILFLNNVLSEETSNSNKDKETMDRMIYLYDYVFVGSFSKQLTEDYIPDDRSAGGGYHVWELTVLKNLKGIEKINSIENNVANTIHVRIPLDIKNYKSFDSKMVLEQHYALRDKWKENLSLISEHEDDEAKISELNEEKEKIKAIRARVSFRNDLTKMRDRGANFSLDQEVLYFFTLRYKEENEYLVDSPTRMTSIGSGFYVDVVEEQIEDLKD